MAISYKPTPTGERFHASNSLIRFVKGPVGSGKSVMMVMELFKRACEQAPDEQGIRYSRFLVSRQTYSQLISTSVATFKSWIPDGELCTWVKSEKTAYIGYIPGSRGNKDKYLFRLPDGTRVHCEVLFRPLDTPDSINNLLSLELGLVFLNECKDISFEVVMALTSRIGRYPSAAMVDGGCTFAGIILDSNPPSNDSVWFKVFADRAEDMSPEDMDKYGMDPSNIPKFELFSQPSGLSDEAENIENLPGGRQYYENIVATSIAEGKDPGFIKSYVEGEWAQYSEGQGVFKTSYRDDIHCTDKVLKPHPGRALIVGIDFGLTPSAVIGQLQPDGQWILFDELTADGMGIQQFSKILRDFMQVNFPGFSYQLYGDPAGAQRAQTDAKSVFDVLRQEGFTAYPSEQSVEMRLESVRAALGRMIGGKPGLIMSNKCKKLRQGFLGGYCYRRVKVSGDRYEEKPSKNKFSHIHDGCQYLLAPFEAPAIKKGINRRFPNNTSGKPRLQGPVSNSGWSIY